jgi:glutathione S-transferase
LIPKDAKLRAQVRWLEKFADYELAPITTFTVFAQRTLRRLYGKETDEALVQQALTNKLPALLDYLASQLGEQDYFVNNTLSLADIAISSQLVNFMHGRETIDAKQWPTLAAYFKRMMSHPTLQALVQREQATLDKLLAAKPSS